MFSWSFLDSNEKNKFLKYQSRLYKFYTFIH